MRFRGVTLERVGFNESNAAKFERFSRDLPFTVTSHEKGLRVRLESDPEGNSYSLRPASAGQIAYIFLNRIDPKKYDVECYGHATDMYGRSSIRISRRRPVKDNARMILFTVPSEA